MAKTGRPTTYSQEIADAICEELATTDHALHRICEREGMPDHATVYRWIASNQDFCDKYARARERQADFLAAQVVEIADTVREGKKVKVSQKDGTTEEHGDQVDRQPRLTPKILDFQVSLDAINVRLAGHRNHKV